MASKNPKAAEPATKLNGEPMPEFTVTRVVVESLYGFYDEENGGDLRMWSPGAVVTDPAEIELLLLRDAPVTAYGEPV
ncbi:hypothetical protein [Aquabacterium olei]|nr:hypothetical protein [Aquabacterium olei]